MTTYIALLRGVNVSGHRPVPMATLRRLAETLGCQNPRTYLQSGNLVFESSATAHSSAEALELGLQKTLGFDVRVGVLRALELDQIIQANPFLSRPPVDAKFLHVCFLLEPWSGAEAPWTALPAQAGEEVHLTRTALYLHLPHGCANSKLTNVWFERKLGVAMTARNWRTVLALQQLAAAPAA